MRSRILLVIRTQSLQEQTRSYAEIVEGSGGMNTGTTGLAQGKQRVCRRLRTKSAVGKNTVARADPGKMEYARAGIAIMADAGRCAWKRGREMKNGERIPLKVQEILVARYR